MAHINGKEILFGIVGRVEGVTVAENAPLITEGAEGITDNAEYIGNYKNALGANITLTDTAAAELQSLIIYGKSTQDGTPTPETPIDIVSLDCTAATFNINDTVIALPAVDEFGGIPVDTGGTYTDANGQQWICDYIDITAKRIVQQTAEMTVDGSGSWSALSVNANVRYAKVLTKKSPSNCVVCDSYLCDTSTSANMADNTVKFGFPTVESSWIYIHNTAYSTIGEFQAALNANPIKVRYALPEPIITPLTDEQVEAFKDLYTSDGTTAIANSIGADMHIIYLAKGV